MSNRRAIVFFLLGSLALAAFLWVFSRRAEAVATVHSRTTLSMFDPADVTALDIRPVGEASVPIVSLERTRGAWRMAAPFVAETDPAAVSRLLDALTLSPALSAIIMRPKSVELRGESVECRVESVEFATAGDSTGKDKGTAVANSTLYTLHSTLKSLLYTLH